MKCWFKLHHCELVLPTVSKTYLFPFIFRDQVSIRQDNIIENSPVCFSLNLRLMNMFYLFCTYSVIAPPFKYYVQNSASPWFYNQKDAPSGFYNHGCILQCILCNVETSSQVSYFENGLDHNQKSNKLTHGLPLGVKTTVNEMYTRGIRKPKSSS